VAGGAAGGVGGADEDVVLMDNYRKEIFAEQLPLVDRFARHLLHHRIIKSQLADHPRSLFWSETCDAHLLQASIYWCMVFGSHGPNRTHLRHLAVDRADELQASFRARVLAALGIDEAEWRSYWAEMRSFRDRYAAHREPGFNQPVPRFDRALEAAFVYEEWIRDVIRPDVVDGPALRQLFTEWEQSVTAEVAAVSASTGQGGGAMKETDTESLWRVENAIGAGFRNIEGMLSFAAIGYLIWGMTGAAAGILAGGVLVECWQWAIDARHDRERQRRDERG